MYARDRSCTRECVTDRNGVVAAAVTPCFVPNQACNAATDDFAHHATIQRCRPKSASLLFAAASQTANSAVISFVIEAVIRAGSVRGRSNDEPELSYK